MGLTRREDCERAIRKGIDFLRHAQLPHGEFRTLVARDENLTVDARVDPSCFATAHIVSSLASLRRNECQPLIESAANFLMSERQAGGLWKFWTSRHLGFANIPPDMDDTSVISLALEDAGQKVSQNRALLHGNRNKSGIFYTWLLRRPQHLRSPRCWLAILTKRVDVDRPAFFSAGQASPEDTDAVVNANAIRWLWKDDAITSQPVAWLSKILEAGEEEKFDRSYQSRHALYYAIARGAQAGISDFVKMGPILVQRIVAEFKKTLHRAATPQISALFQLALSVWEPDHPLLESEAAFLINSQNEDGSWPGEAYFYGGWNRIFRWGSSELTTAFCIEALARFAELRK